ncbi:MAG: hypothetical protein ACRENF_03825 [Thermodesulfobacteriota bacterium]
MKTIIFICGLIFLSGCGGESYRARNSDRVFKPDVCLNIPVGIEKFQYLDPSVKHLKISCADVARCAAQTGQGAPLNVPCE